jgi:hypothetical protein
VKWFIPEIGTPAVYPSRRPALDAEAHRRVALRDELPRRAFLERRPRARDGAGEGGTMSKHMHVVPSAIAVALVGALTGCLTAAEEEPETASAQQAIWHNEVRVQEIFADVLVENGDEIYMTASQSNDESNVNIIRPDAVPDYWRFDDPDTAHFPKQHVGTIVPGSYLIVNLWEQNAGADHEIGTIGFKLDNAGKPTTYDTPTGKFVGINNDGLWVVRFTNGARYAVYFKIGQ